MIRGNRRCKDAGELGKRDRNRGDRSGLDNEEKRPAEKETDRRSVRVPEKNVNTTGARHHCRQLGAAKRTSDRHHAGDRPREQQPTRRAGQPRRFRGGNENARADHRADNDHRGVERAEATDQVMIFGSRRRFHFRVRYVSNSGGGAGNGAAIMMSSPSSRSRNLRTNSTACGLSP